MPKREKKSLIGYIDWNDFQIFGAVDKITGRGLLYTPNAYQDKQINSIKVRITIEEVSNAKT